jgi:hypothetical protein
LVRVAWCLRLLMASDRLVRHKLKHSASILRCRLAYSSDTIERSPFKIKLAIELESEDIATNYSIDILFYNQTKENKF